MKLRKLEKTFLSHDRYLIPDGGRSISVQVRNSGSAGVFTEIKQRFLDGPTVRAPRVRCALPFHRVSAFTPRYSSAEQTESGQTDSSDRPCAEGTLFRIAREAGKGGGYGVTVHVIKVCDGTRGREKKVKRKSNAKLRFNFQAASIIVG